MPVSPASKLPTRLPLPPSPTRRQETGYRLGTGIGGSNPAKRAPMTHAVGPFLNKNCPRPSLESINARRGSRLSPSRDGKRSPRSCFRTTHSSALGRLTPSPTKLHR